MRKALLFVAAISLAGCSTSQRHAGITEATIEKSPDGSYKGYIIDGKDRGESKLDMTLTDGTAVHFESKQVDASTAQAQQAEANSEILGKLIDRIPAVSP